MRPVSFISIKLFADLSEAAPRIFIVPDYFNVFGINLFPPIFEFSFGYIKRRRRNQVIKDNIVLLAPAESAEMI